MQTKNIKQLLSDYHIAVPEIQREYVWGMEENKTVLFQFLEDLNSEKTSNIGFLYSYEPGHTNNEIYLIDGQQRFTTALLLMFYLALKEGESTKQNFNNLLRLNEPTPSFSYRVRNLTQNFLCTMWKETSNLDNLLKIKAQKWYISAYDNDTTIKAILSALSQIHKFAETHKGNFHLTYEECLTNIEFWYFNVGQTSQGEELYITMNSRGEQLTDSEQLKPLLFAKAKEEKIISKNGISWGKAWDNWDEFFFSQKHEDQSINDVDSAMNNFLKAIIELKSMQEHNKIVVSEDRDHLSLNEIESHFESLERVAAHPLFKEEINRLMGNKTNISDSNLLTLKSLLIAYQRGFQDERDYLRLFKLIRNTLRRGIINHIPFLEFLNKLRQSDKNLYEFILAESNNGEIKNVLDAHEIDKIKIYSRYIEINDTEIEELFWRAEELPYTQGSIKSVWHEKFTSDASRRCEWQTGDKVIFANRLHILEELFSTEHTSIVLSRPPQDGIIDNALIARTLLACYGDYSYNTGGKNWCYGYKYYWKEIFKRTPKAISTLIDNLYSCHSTNYYTCMNAIISNTLEKYDLSKKDGKYYVLKYNDSLQALDYGYNILCFINDEWNNYWINILNKERASSLQINLFEYLVFKHLNDKSIVSNQYLGMKNGLSVSCAENHGWVIFYPENTPPENVERYSTQISNLLGVNYKIRCNIDKHLFYIPIDLNQDLIEEGCYIIEQIHSIS